MRGIVYDIIVVVAVALAGCQSPEPFDNIVVGDAPETFNYVAPINARGAAAVYEDASYFVVFDEDKRTANLTIANLRVPGYDEPRTLTFTDLEMSYTPNSHETERIIREDVLVSSDPATAGTAITGVTIIYIKANDLDSNHTDGIYARFTVDGRYVVTAYPYYVLAEGTTRVDDISTPDEVIDYNTTYYLHLNPSAMTASLAVRALPLDDVMVDVDVLGLKLALVDDGYELEMTSSGGLMTSSGVKITELSAMAMLRDELKIDMMVEYAGKQYRVAAFLSPNLSKSVLDLQ